MNQLKLSEDVRIVGELGGGISDDVARLNPDLVEGDEELRKRRSGRRRGKTKNKYNAETLERVVPAGILRNGKPIPEGETVTFDSKAEARHFDALLLLRNTGKIENLELQPRFRIQEAIQLSDFDTLKSVNYTPDFRYVRNGQAIVEEIKGRETARYRLILRIFLKQMLEGKHGEFEFRVTGARKGELRLRAAYPR